jgi:hypothetical protein
LGNGQSPAVVAGVDRDQWGSAEDFAVDAPFFNISSMCFWRLAISGTFDVTPTLTSLWAGTGEHPEDVRNRTKDNAIGMARIRCSRGARTQGDRSLMWEPPEIYGGVGADLVMSIRGAHPGFGRAAGQWFVGRGGRGEEADGSMTGPGNSLSVTR